MIYTQSAAQDFGRIEVVNSQNSRSLVGISYKGKSFRFPGLFIPYQIDVQYLPILTEDTYNVSLCQFVCKSTSVNISASIRSCLQVSQ